MSLTEIGRRTLHVSIGIKIFTVALSVLVLMCLVTMLTVVMANAVSRELTSLGQRYIPAYSALARSHIWSIERSFYVRRVVISAREGEDAAQGSELQRRADEAGATSARYMADGRRFLHEALAEGAGNASPIVLSRIDALLEMLDEARAQLFARHAALMTAVLGGADPAATRPLLAQVEEERSAFDRRLDATRSEMYDALVAAAATTQGEQSRVVQAVIVITGFAGVLGLLFAGAFSLGMSRPVRRLLEGTRAVQGGRLDTVIPVTSQDEIGLLTSGFNAMVTELRIKSQIKETFGRYIDPRIVQGLIDRPDLAATRGERRVMTVLFCDMKGFTSLSEGMTPTGLVTIINHYLTVMSEPIRQQDGIIDKYIGDAIMAFWGPPFVASEDQAKLACLAALGQVARLPALAAALPELIGIKTGLPTISIRVGIATGEVIVGNIGSDVTQSYTVMGDTVNLASRLEGANKSYGTRLLVSEETARLASADVELREIDAILVVGKSEPQRVFEILGRKGEVSAAVLLLRDRFAEGLAAYRRQDWAAARAAFAECLTIDAEDKASQVFRDRIEELAAHPPGGGWNGVWVMEGK